MTNYEIVMVITAIVGLLIAGTTAFIALRNLRLLVKSHKDNHEWSRRIETKKALSRIRGINIGELDDELDYYNHNASVSLEKMLDVFSNKPRLRAICHDLLNFHEGIASGVLTGVYDELLVKKTRKGAMERYFMIFENYINHRRNQLGRSTLFFEQQRLIEKWTNETVSGTDKAPTGKI